MLSEAGARHAYGGIAVAILPRPVTLHKSMRQGGPTVNSTLWLALNPSKFPQSERHLTSSLAAETQWCSRLVIFCSHVHTRCAQRWDQRSALWPNCLRALLSCRGTATLQVKLYREFHHTLEHLGARQRQMEHQTKANVPSISSFLRSALRNGANRWTMLATRYAQDERTVGTSPSNCSPIVLNHRPAAGGRNLAMEHHTKANQTSIPICSCYWTRRRKQIVIIRSHMRAR